MAENTIHDDGGAVVLGEGEAWCEACQQIVAIIGPRQDACPCGTCLSRSCYGEKEESDG